MKTWLPYSNNPQRHLRNVATALSLLLYMGKIYKCGHLAHIEDPLERFDRPNYDDWLPALGHDHNPGDNMQAFADNFGKPIVYALLVQSAKDKDNSSDHKNVDIKTKLPHYIEENKGATPTSDSHSQAKRKQN